MSALVNFETQQPTRMERIMRKAGALLVFLGMCFLYAMLNATDDVVLLITFAAASGFALGLGGTCIALSWSIGRWQRRVVRKKLHHGY
jgi:hypothetical protein